MTIRIISIGKTNIGFVKAGIDEYLKRLTHYAKVTWEELPDPKKVDRTNVSALQSKEADAFLDKIDRKDYVVLLDENGQQWSSVDFSNWIAHSQMNLSGDLVFIIGGAYGFDQRLLERAQKMLSLSLMTFNHQMVRMIFTEQLYRAFTIIRGEPYHHA